MVERAKSVFDASIVPENVTIHVRPIPFERDKLNEFSLLQRLAQSPECVE